MLGEKNSYTSTNAYLTRVISSMFHYSSTVARLFEVRLVGRNFLYLFTDSDAE